MLFFIYFNYLI